MGATNIKCPSGHSNPVAQRFCGECGVSLVGVCPAGHVNPPDQRYCGECGNPIGELATPGRPTESEVVTPSEPDPAKAPNPTAAPSRSEPDKEAGTVGAPDPPFGRFEPPVVVPGTSHSAAAGATGRIKSQWVKLPKWGKIAVAAGIPVVVVLLLFGGGGRDKESYAFGYRHGSSGLTKDWVRGTSDGAKKTCEEVVDFYIDLSKKEEIDRGDAVEGCVDAVNGRPLGPG